VAANKSSKARVSTKVTQAKATKIATSRGSRKQSVPIAIESSEEDDEEELESGPSEESGAISESEAEEVESKYLVEAVFLNAGPFKHLIAKLSNILSGCPIEFVPPRASPLPDDEPSLDDGSGDDQDLSEKIINSTEVNDEKFHITGGIRFFVITEDHKVVIKATLNANMLHKFHCEELTKIGINPAPLSRALKIVGDNDILTIRILRDNRDFLHISGKEVRKDINRVSEMKMYLPKAESYPADLCMKKYDYEITISAADVQRVCKNMTTGSPDLQIWSNGEDVSFRSEGDSITSASKYSKADASECDYDEYLSEDEMAMDGLGRTSLDTSSKKLRYFGSFDLKNMSIFASTAKSDTHTIRLYLKQDEPLMIWTSISNIGNLYVMLVPVLKTKVFRQ